MKSQLLIDAIVRQTTVLIARLSTAEGARSPLGHIANEIFSGLVVELESQGVSKKVIADMFGMALRSYRQKIQRLGESATSRGVTLWNAVQGFLGEHAGGATRSEVLERFKYDEEVSVRGILNDLVESGFVVRSGRGDETRYRVATEEELRDLGATLEREPGESVAALVWLLIFREGPTTLDRIAQLVPLSKEAIAEAVAHLTDSGRVTRRGESGNDVYSAEELLIPLGEAAGWEAAVVDHHRTVVNAIAAKVTSGARTSSSSDEVGGTTLTFELWPGHPKEQEVRQLLATTRAAILPMWDEVMAHNRSHQGKGAYHVHFYCGQYVVTEEDVP